MLASLRLKSVRQTLVIILMILSAFVVVERVQTVLNGIQHGLGIEHSAPMIDVADVGHDHDHDLDRFGDDGTGSPGDNDHMPGAHHHHSEGPQVAALPASVSADTVGAPLDIRILRADLGSPQRRIFGLERPPKALVDRA